MKALFEGEQKERSRLGRELHDGIGGMLITLNAQLENFRSAYAFEEHEAMADIMNVVNETSKELRNTIHNLIPESILLHGLEETIRNYAKLLNKHSLLDIQIFVCGNWSLVKGNTVLNVFRIVQELLQNIVKHASATVASINIVLTDKKIKLTVEDNGRGIIQPVKSKGNGLANIRWRVASLMGIMSVESAIGKGTIVLITLPHDETNSKT